MSPAIAANRLSKAALLRKSADQCEGRGEMSAAYQLRAIAAENEAGVWRALQAQS